MKKLITLSVILLLTVSLFGQTQGVFGLIFDEPEYQYFERMDAEGDVVPFIDGTTPAYNQLSKNYYHFIKDDKLYMLSYADTINRSELRGKYYERPLYLFCWDNGVWSKASDVIQVDKRFENGGIDGYLPMHGGHFGGRVDVMKGNTILITLATHYIPTEPSHELGVYSSTVSLKSFVLFPNGDGTYSVIHDIK